MFLSLSFFPPSILFKIKNILNTVLEKIWKIWLKIGTGQYLSIITNFVRRGYVKKNLYFLVMQSKARNDMFGMLKIFQ